MYFIGDGEEKMKASRLTIKYHYLNIIIIIIIMKSVYYLFIRSTWEINQFYQVN